MALRQVFNRFLTQDGWFGRTDKVEEWFNHQFTGPDLGFVFVGSAHVGDQTAHTASTFTAPSGIQAGDALLMYAYEQGSGAHTFSADNGFGSANDVQFQTACNEAFWFKVASGSESGATITVTTSASFKRTILFLALRPPSGSAAARIDTFVPAISGSNSTTVVAPAATPTTVHDALITFHGTATPSTTQPWTTPSGFQIGPVDDTAAQTTGSGAASFYRLDIGAAGASTGTTSSTHTNPTNVWGAYTVLLTFQPVSTGYIGWGIHI